MAEEESTLRMAARHLVLAIRPLEQAVQDAESFAAFMLRMGWEAQDVPPQFSALVNDVAGAVAALEGLADDATLGEVIDVIKAAGDVYRSVHAISQTPNGVDAADAADFLARLAGNTFELLIVEYLAEAAPAVHNTLCALGVIESVNVAPTPTRPGYLAIRLNAARIREALTEPHLIPERVYGWGSDDFAFETLAGYAVELFRALRWEAYYQRADRRFGAAFQGALTDTKRAAVSIFKIPLLNDFIAGEEIEVGIGALELPPETGKPAGIVVLPYAPSVFTTSVTIAERWTLGVRAGTDLANQFGLVLRPGEISVRYPFQPGMQLPSAGFGLTLAYDSGDKPKRLFGSAEGIRLELSRATLAAEFNVKNGDVELKFGAAPDSLTLVVTGSDLDGFLGSVLGGKEARIAFPLGLFWSNRTGLDFVAGLGFEISVYPHLDLKFLRFDRVDLGVRFTSGAGEPPQLDFTVASAFSGSLGPISYSVDRLGVHLPITFQAGNAGPFDIGFGVLAPLGIGLVIDAGAVTGGGFIKYDPEAGRYCGMLELKMFEIGVAAIGILDTKDAAGARLPPPGYSFFISVAAEFSPIQLGWGFTLNGIGGLAGVHRRMDVDALLSRMREGALDSIMFPKDPVVNAAAIISNLTTIFPIAMNRYVFGPMAIIGWPTPALVRVELGVVLEVPSPIVLALLGKARIAIPPELDEPVISIKVDVVGVLDYGRSLFAVDATLRDSYVAAFDIQGDMAMRLTWAGKRNLALAIGGLHPQFAPPPGFPTLRRVTVAFGNGENPRITLEGYFALTSNSRQFGAKAELYAEAAGFSVHGWLGFDALYTVRPLWFRIDFEAGMTLNRGSRRIAGITVRGALTGPSPFHVWGEGCISLLFFDVCVPFDKTFGLPRTFDLPGKDPWLVLKAAIENVENWAAELGEGVAVAAAMRAAPPGAAPLLLHPMGAATLRQRALPFNRLLERFGEFDIIGPNRYDIADVKVGDNDEPDWTIANDDFAPGDFEALSETDRLSRDSFESMAAGVRVGGDLVHAPQDGMKIAKVAYETRIIDASWDVRVLPRFLLSRAVQLLTGIRGAKASSDFARSGRGKFARDVKRAAGVSIQPETYVVATVDTLVPRVDIADQATRGAAHLAVKAKLGRGARASSVQVVPSHELEIAA